MANISVKDSSNNVVSIPITPIGQQASANSVSMVVASDQSTIPVKVAMGLPSGANTVGAVTQSGTWNITVNTGLPTGANTIGAVTFASALPTGANVVGGVTQSGTWNVSVNTGLPTGANTIGAVASIVAALPAGTNTLGSVKLTDGTNVPAAKAASTAAIATDPSLVVALSPNSPIPTGTNNIGGVFNKATTAGGLTGSRILSAASTNATSVKASAGQAYLLDIGNNGAADAYFKLYNKASAPTVGTDTPVATIYLPKGAARTINLTDLGVVFSTGIAYAITGVGTDADTTAVAAAQVVGLLGYA